MCKSKDQYLELGIHLKTKLALGSETDELAINFFLQQAFVNDAC